ncbi:MAG TPA: glycosyltransferase [Candidatus Elarobacter sp.]|jgi:dolichol-phosphate mannosyltransferase|nr:glycosyltransferase [Candidatus Elarobacter sp.]
MLLVLAVVLEALAAARAALRMIRTAGGSPLAAPNVPPAPGTIVAIVPVLNEASRVGTALDALAACGDELAEIVVVDGGSIDGTRKVVAAAADRAAARTEGTRPIRFVSAPQTPPDWNGKVWNLHTGLLKLAASDESVNARGVAPWVAMVDADVRVGPRLLAAAVARAQRDGLAALSVATRQELADAGAALLHPALLTTLVYRAGLPNVATTDPSQVQANGQVFVARRDALERTGAFRVARASRCEDITVARVLAAAGERVGFYEGDAVVRMHDSWRDCAANWPRSLTLRDAFVSPRKLALALAELLLAQALPLPALIALLALGERVPFARPATAVAFALVAMRLGVLVGTRRAYVRPPVAYWLSPLADLPAVVLLIASALRRKHVWRGRTLVAETPV